MKKHISAGLLLVVLLGLLTGGGVIAYFNDQAPLLSTPEFEFGTVNITVEKIKGGGAIVTPKEKSGHALWRVTNTGSKDVMIRARVIEDAKQNREDDDEKDSSATAAIGDKKGQPDVEIKVKGWTKGNDDYYYLGKPVSKRSTTDIDLAFEVVSPWSGEYKLFLEAQAVQAANNAIDVVWPGNPGK